MNIPRLLQHTRPCLLFAALLFNVQPICAQEPKETAQDLSKGARKGMFADFKTADDGSIQITYMLKMDKKSDEVTYEDYLFDKDLNFKGKVPSKLAKEQKPNRTMVGIVAQNGVGTNMSMLSQNLVIYREEWEEYWDYNHQTYKRGKTLSSKSVKPRNNNAKFKGFAYFRNDQENGAVVFASYDLGKNSDDQFVCLYINMDVDIKETKVPVTGNYSMVYCGSLKSGNYFMVLAPNSGMPDTRKYVYAEFSSQGDLVTHSEFNSPSSNMLIMDHREMNGDLYFCGGSTDKNVAYNTIFSNYVPIRNPSYQTAANYQMEKYDDKVYKVEFDNFHFLKLQKGQVVFATTTPTNDMEKKVKTPPSQKKAHPYKGRKITFQTLEVAPNGNFLMAGQLMGKVIMKEHFLMKYTDLVAFMFNPKGELITQYAVEKMNNDKESEVFEGDQDFIISPDGKTAYWEIYEVKGFRGFDNFFAAMNGRESFKAGFFPRIARINLETGDISDFKVLGDKGKYFMDDTGQKIMTDQGLLYLGHDEDFEKIWLARYPLL